MVLQKIAGGSELLNPEKILNHVGVTYGNTVADLGCGGAAYFTLQAAKMIGDAGKVYAVDILKPALASVESKAALNNLTNIIPIWSNLELYGAAKIPDRSCDLVFLHNALFQNEKRLEILKEATRLMKPGGKLTLVEWKETNIPFGPPSELRVKKEDARLLAHQLGLKEIDDFNAGTYHYGLVFQKV